MDGFIEGTPVVTLELDKPRQLALTLGAMRRVRERIGGLKVDTDKPEQLAVFVWACLDKGGRSDLQVEDVEDMIHLGNMEKVAAAVRQLRGVSDPEPGANPTAEVPAEPVAIST